MGGFCILFLCEPLRPVEVKTYTSITSMACLTQVYDPSFHRLPWSERRESLDLGRATAALPFPPLGVGRFQCLLAQKKERQAKDKEPVTTCWDTFRGAAQLPAVVSIRVRAACCARGQSHQRPTGSSSLPELRCFSGFFVPNDHDFLEGVAHSVRFRLARA